MSLEFLLTSLVVVLLPGTGVIYTLAIGLGRGFRASVAAAVGCTVGIVPAAVASIIGLAALLHTSALAFQVIKYLGVAYLFYMAWKLLRDKSVMDVSENPNATTALVGLAGVFMAMTFVVFVAYGAFAAFARDYVIQRPSVMTWIKRSFAGTFGLLGAKLAISN